MRKMSVTPSANDQSTSHHQPLTQNPSDKQPISDHIVKDYNLNASQGMNTPNIERV